jgi:predicted amidophosphoribosyltransferase
LPFGLSKLFGQQGLLIKTRDTTETKTKTTYQERRDNLAGAFSIHPALSETFAKKYAGKRVLVVDDVFTTGSTMNECAKVLLEAGIKKVDGLVLVRASLR